MMNKPISQKTMEQYKANLRILKKFNIPIDGSMNARAIVDALTNRDYSKSSIKSFLSAIKKTIPDTATNAKFIDDLSDNILILGSKIIQESKSNIPEFKWADIMHIYNELHNELKDKVAYKGYVILSLYVRFPVRGLEDYADMHVVFKNSDMISNSYNYYAYHLNRFIFNKYRNYAEYGRQVFEVPPALDKILKEYIDTYDILGSLFNLSVHTLGLHLRNAFKERGLDISGINDIKALFIAHEKTKAMFKDKECREYLSLQMGRNIDQDETFLENVMEERHLVA